MHDRALRTKQPASATGKKIQRGPLRGKRLTIRDLGWTREHAREVRATLAMFAVDWDDPSMDIYNGPSNLKAASSRHTPSCFRHSARVTPAPYPMP